MTQAKHVNDDIPTLAGLGLPRTVLELALGSMLRMHGLILVAGMPGSGKSSSIAAMIEFLNRQVSGHIVTLEDDIRYLHRPASCIVSQCQLNPVPASRLAQLRAARNWSADLVVIDCPHDAVALSSAVEMAEAGRAVIASVDGTNANVAIQVLMRHWAATGGSQVAEKLAGVLRMVISQKLVPRRDGTGQAPAVEVVLNDRTIFGLLLYGRLDEIHERVKASRAQGMQTIEHALGDLHAAGTISLDDATRWADSPDELRVVLAHAKPQAERTPHAVFSALLQKYGVPRIVIRNWAVRRGGGSQLISQVAGSGGEDPFAEGLSYYRNPLGQEPFLSVTRYVELDASDVPAVRETLLGMGIIEVLRSGVRRSPAGAIGHVVRAAVRSDVVPLTAAEVDEALKRRRMLDVDIEQSLFGHAYVRFSVATREGPERSNWLRLLFDSPCCLADEEVSLVSAYGSWEQATTVLDEFGESFTRQLT